MDKKVKNFMQKTSSHSFIPRAAADYPFITSKEASMTNYFVKS